MHKDRNIAMISYLSIIGLIIALASTKKTRSDYLKYHLKNSIWINAFSIFLLFVIPNSAFSDFMRTILIICVWIVFYSFVVGLIQAYHMKYRQSGKWVTVKPMDEGLQNLIFKAKQGDVQAMAMVGDCYNRGFHAEQDDKKAHQYYQMAADKGDAKAATLVAIDYLNGIGTSLNEKLGKKYLEIGVDGGNPMAMYILGSMYELGKIKVPENERIAMHYYEKAAKLGDAKSQIALSDLIVKSDQPNEYTIDDVFFWVICAYFHGVYSPKESEEALKRINYYKSEDIPGWKEKIEELTEKINNGNYQQYLRNPE